MHANLSDDELLQLVRAGDESAFVALYRRRQSGIYRFALRMSGSESIAEDVVQEVFMSLMRSNGNYNAARGSFSAYLFGIARNQVLRRFEKDRFLAPLIESEDEDGAPLPAGLIIQPDPLGDLARQETIDAVRQAVSALPAHYREVVLLCDLHELSYAEAAAALGCAVGTVRSRLHRGRALLVERLRAQQSAAAPNAANAVNCFV